jgi:hypothetical protein
MTPASRADFRAELLAQIPEWYRPAAHLLLPAFGGIVIAGLALSRLHDVRPWQLAFVPVFLVLGNAIEWHAHRGLLHRRTRYLELLYLRHTPIHHALYVSDAMAIRSTRELRFILLPGYGILIIAAASSPMALALLWLDQPNLAALWVACAVGYLLAYEWLHLSYHLPESSSVGRLRMIGWLRRHHALHHAPHLMQRWNFNVTVPLWDHVRGTVHSAAPAGSPTPEPALAPRAH